MEMIDRLLEGIDLRVVYAVLVLIGVLTSVYLMQLSRFEPAEDYEPSLARFLRRMALAALTWALLWCLSYSYGKGWQPWPPDLFLIAALDGVIMMRAISLKVYLHRGVPSSARVSASRLLHP